ncbi:MAG: hypothetical protein AAF317_18440, partial [Pseudomonadota bacterium]
MTVRFLPFVAESARSGRTGAQLIAAAPPRCLSVINTGIPLDHADPDGHVTEGSGPGERAMINRSRRTRPARSDRTRSVVGATSFDGHTVAGL